MADGHMNRTTWSDLRLNDQITAHHRAFPFDHHKVPHLPKHLSVMFDHLGGLEAQMVTGEKAAKLTHASMVATWKVLR